MTEKVEALYDQVHTLAGEDEGPEMRKLRAEMHHRMLGDGYCARPVELDCHFESIRKSCSFCVSTIPPRHRRLTRARRRCSHRRENVNRLPEASGDGLGVQAVSAVSDGQRQPTPAPTSARPGETKIGVARDQP